MSDFDWRSAVGAIAPTIATALGGPLAGMAVKVLGDKLLGRPDATPDEISAAVAGMTADQVLALKVADQNFALELAKIDAAETTAYLADVSNARARQVATGDAVPQYILAGMFALLVLQLLLIFFGPKLEDETLKTLLVKCFSITEIGFTTALGYFLGSSRGSKQSGDSLRATVDRLASKS